MIKTMLRQMTYLIALNFLGAVFEGIGEIDEVVFPQCH